MEGLRLKPFGDKLVLRELSPEERGVLIIGKEVLAEVVAVGEGIPYGRGEFYSPVAQVGMRIIVLRKVWDDRDTTSIMWNGERHVVLSERLCIAGLIND